MIWRTADKLQRLPSRAQSQKYCTTTTYSGTLYLKWEVTGICSVSVCFSPLRPSCEVKEEPIAKMTCKLPRERCTPRSSTLNLILDMFNTCSWTKMSLVHNQSRILPKSSQHDEGTTPVGAQQTQFCQNSAESGCGQSLPWLWLRHLIGDVVKKRKREDRDQVPAENLHVHLG